MGMFDSVYADCPKCGSVQSVEFQSKVDACILKSYSNHYVPLNIAEDIKGDWGKCYDCGEQFHIVLEEEIPETVRMKLV